MDHGNFLSGIFVREMCKLFKIENIKPTPSDDPSCSISVSGPDFEFIAKYKHPKAQCCSEKSIMITHHGEVTTGEAINWYYLRVAFSISSKATAPTSSKAIPVLVLSHQCGT